MAKDLNKSFDEITLKDVVDDIDHEIWRLGELIKDKNREISRLEKLLEKQEDEGVYDETLYTKLDDLIGERDHYAMQKLELEK